MDIAHKWKNDGLAECEPEQGCVLNSVQVDQVLHLIDNLQDLEGPFLPVGHWVLQIPIGHIFSEGVSQHKGEPSHHPYRFESDPEVGLVVFGENRKELSPLVVV